MGATTVYFSCKGNEQAMRKAFAKKVKSDSVQYGIDPYSGSFSRVPGVQVRGTVFNTVDEVHEFLDRVLQKYEPAIAVQVKVFKPNATIERLSKEINELWNQSFGRDVTERTKKSLENKRLKKEAKRREWMTKLAQRSKRTNWIIGACVAT